MEKINFTKEHKVRMEELLLSMVLNNEVINGKIGGTLTAQQLLHEATINQLRDMHATFTNKIKNLENKDEWVASDSDQVALDKAKKRRELLNLLIGYKRYKLQLEEAKSMREKLQGEIEALKDSQKTPADRIKELEEQLTALGDEEF